MNKLDLIINAFESAHHTNDTGVLGLTKLRHDVALTAARELRELKPVGYGFKGLNDQIMDCTTDKDVEYCIPLYALDEVTK